MIKKSFVILVALLLGIFLALPSFGAQNIINSVVISKNAKGVYELGIDSSKTVQYKQFTDDEGGVYFDLKNSKMAKNVSTVYDDVIDISSVSVKKIDNNKVRIYIKGKNVKNIQIAFINSILDNNMGSAAIEDVSQIGDNQDWDNNTFNLAHLIKSAILGIKEGSIGILALVMTLFAVFFAIIKTLNSKLPIERSNLIYAQNFESESELIRNLNQYQALRGTNGELNKARNDYNSYVMKKYWKDDGNVTNPYAKNLKEKINYTPKIWLENNKILETTPTIQQ